MYTQGIQRCWRSFLLFLPWCLVWFCRILATHFQKFWLKDSSHYNPSVTDFYCRFHFWVMQMLVIFFLMFPYTLLSSSVLTLCQYSSGTHGDLHFRNEVVSRMHSAAFTMMFILLLAMNCVKSQTVTYTFTQFPYKETVNNVGSWCRMSHNI